MNKWNFIFLVCLEMISVGDLALATTTLEDIRLEVNFGDKRTEVRTWQDSNNFKFTYHQGRDLLREGELEKKDFDYFIALATDVKKKGSKPVAGCPRRFAKLTFVENSKDQVVTSCLHSKLPVGKAFEKLMAASALLIH